MSHNIVCSVYIISCRTMKNHYSSKVDIELRRHLADIPHNACQYSLYKIMVLTW